MPVPIARLTGVQARLTVPPRPSHGPRHPLLRWAEWRFLSQLAELAPERTPCFLSVAAQARRARMAANTAFRAVSSLERAGYVRETSAREPGICGGWARCYYVTPAGRAALAVPLSGREIP